jgi:hypothetical protein
MNLLKDLAMVGLLSPQKLPQSTCEISSTNPSAPSNYLIPPPGSIEWLDNLKLYFMIGHPAETMQMSRPLLSCARLFWQKGIKPSVAGQNKRRRGYIYSQTTYAISVGS